MAWERRTCGGRLQVVLAGLCVRRRAGLAGLGSGVGVGLVAQAASGLRDFRGKKEVLKMHAGVADTVG